MENKVFFDEEVFEQIRPCGGGGGGDGDGVGPGGGHQAHKSRRWRSASFWRRIRNVWPGALCLCLTP